MDTKCGGYLPAGAEHLINREALWSIILFGVAGTDVPSLHAFLEVISENGQEYDSDHAGNYSPLHECFLISDEHATDTASKLMPLDMSLTMSVAYLKEKVERLKA